MKNKGKRLKHKNRRHKSSTSEPRVRRFFLFGWQFLTGLALLLGLVVTLYNLSARVEVSSSDVPIDPHSPFSSPFNVKNCGILPIYNVLFSYGVRNVKLSNGTTVSNLTVAKDKPLIRQIDAGEATTAFCVFDDVFRPRTHTTTIESADIEVNVRYRPAYLPWSKIRPFRFVTVI